MTIAIFPSLEKKEVKPLAKEIEAFFKAKKLHVVTDNETADELSIPPISSVNSDEIRFFISLGGDGTILRLLHKYQLFQIPILGINLGHLGFMADVPLSDLYPSLEDLLKGAYRIDNRVVIEGHKKGKLYPNNLKCDKETPSSCLGTNCFAVNDIVIHRGKYPNLIEIEIHVDGLFLNTFVADGIILATPNGSTAYSLAAGGPILSPNLEAMVLTPISPHTISNRPIVLMTSQKIQIKYLGESKSVDVSADGYIDCQLSPQESIEIKRSSKTFKLVSLHRHDYFTTLRSKLGWSGKLR